MPSLFCQGMVGAFNEYDAMAMRGVYRIEMPF